MFDLKEIIELMKNDPRVENKEDDVAFNKFFNDLSHKANEMGVLSKCALCGENISGKANSHSVPQSILKNINTDGHYCQITCAVGEGLIFGPLGRINRTGLNNTGTFHLLCKECENKTFHNYENPSLLNAIADNRIDLLTDEILAEMMLKSALREKYKKEFSKNLTILNNEIADKNNCAWNTSTLSDELNIQEYDSYINKCVDIINNNKVDQFNIFYFDILDHSSDFACQTLIAIQKTVTNELINDVYNYDPNYHIVMSHFIVFPLKDKTICLGYCLKEEETRLRPFVNYANGLNQASKRKLFQSTLFLHSEEVYTNEAMIEELMKDEITSSFIHSGVENGWTTESNLKKNKLLIKPNLIAPNNFRKAKFFL